MAFRLFSQTAKPSSMSDVSEAAIGDKEEGLKKELIFACIIERIGILLRFALPFLFFCNFGATGIIFFFFAATRKSL